MGQLGTEPPAAAASVSEVSTAIPSTPGIRLGKLALAHSLVLLVSLSLFGAADAWTAVSGLAIASVLGVVSGALAGIAVANLVHEWFHFLGALFVRGRYTVPDKIGLFLYDWDFERNNVRQFEIMSVAGSIGGLFAIYFLWNAVPSDSTGRAALHAGAMASFVFAAFIEWPVLHRTRHSGKPLEELSKINGRVLTRSFALALLTLLLATTWLSP